MTDEEVRLVDQLTGADTRWHRRTITRHWHDDPTPPPWMSEEGCADAPDVADDGDDGIRIGFHIQLITPADDAANQLSIRGILEAANVRYEGAFDFEARFHIAKGFEPSIEQNLDYLKDFGLDFVFGYLFAALGDAVRSVGLPAPVFPPTELERVKHQILQKESQ